MSMNKVDNTGILFFYCYCKNITQRKTLKTQQSLHETPAAAD